ncbi:MAG: hypothetical protein CMH46_06570 [Muricauda sp.]|nr:MULTISPECIES: hypothetical protein [unclassified Allomuricauda]MAU15190.1 hypothetical protein [Allomuricauda sp.]
MAYLNPLWQTSKNVSFQNQGKKDMDDLYLNRDIGTVLGIPRDMLYDGLTPYIRPTTPKFIIGQKKIVQKERPCHQGYRKVNVDKWTTIVKHTSN